jgi:hypothetical protein
MDTVGTKRIERLLGELEAMHVGDDGSTSEVFAQVVAVISAINWLVSQSDLFPSTTTPSDDVLERLKHWIDRLVQKLTEIVKELADGTSFSISVGTGVSVTVSFPPYKKASV